MTCYACSQRFRESSVCVCGIPHVELLLEMLRAIDRAKAKRKAMADIEPIVPMAKKRARKSA